MKVKRTKIEKNGEEIVETTKIGKPKPAFQAVVQECKLAMNFSYAIDTVDDGEGNPITFRLWVNGAWNVEYKGKEYIIPVNENISALIAWINSKKEE